MESRESISTESGDYLAAVPLEISHEVASRADDLLREFAEDSGLETALIVDRSGGLVAGISAEAEVTVEVISALVAGASGAMRALVSQLGETGAMESLHLGGDRMIYLREIVNRFILVGVSDATRPAGLVRSKAHAIEDELTELLGHIRPAEVPLASPAGSTSRSLREVALRRAAERLVPERATEREPASAPEPEPPGGNAEPVLPAAEAEREELESEPVFVSGAFIEPGALPLAEGPPAEPREILEPLDSGEPEIVIEPSTPLPPLPVDSPFEVEIDEPGDEVEAVEDGVDELGTEKDVLDEIRLEEDEAVEGGTEEDGLDEDEADEETAPLVPPVASVFEIEAVDEGDNMGGIEDTADEFEPLELTEPAPPTSFFEFLEKDEDESTAEAPASPFFESHDLDEVAEEGEGVNFDGSEDFEESDRGEKSEPFLKSDSFPVTEHSGVTLFEGAVSEAGDAGNVGTNGEGDDSRNDEEDIAEEIREMIDEEEDESEVRSSGPFYF